MSLAKSYRPSLTLSDIAYLVDLLDAQPFSTARNSAYTKLLSTYSKAVEGELKPAYTASHSTLPRADKAFALLEELEAKDNPTMPSKESQWHQAYAAYRLALDSITQPAATIDLTNLPLALTDPEITYLACEHCYLNEHCWPAEIESPESRFEKGENVLLTHAASIIAALTMTTPL